MYTKLKYALGGFLAGVLASLAVIFYTNKPTPPVLLTQTDTVYVQKIPLEVLNEIAALRKENLTLKERLQGWTIPKGEGPVVVYLPLVKIDTALASVTVKNNYIYTTLQAPLEGDTAHSARLIRLPRVNISDCRNFGIGGNGVVRCQTSPFGRLNVFTAVNIVPLTPEFQGGLEWYKGNLTVPVYYSNHTKLTVGIRYTRNLF